ncbi:MAG: autotransporter-associated beta strand repeat-containing protein [Verrucomicrobia bacterium]|nr:autotransporter-associated beta strand repeat-containing protein [Verrucomicrobiota bacterium]
MLLSSPAPAAIRTWDCGAGAPGNWSDRRNWQGDIAPVDGDTLVFPAGAACLETFNDFNPPNPVPVFNQLLLTGNGYRLDGFTTLVLSGGISASAANATNWLEHPVGLTADQTFECTQSSSLLVLRTLALESHELTLDTVGDIRVIQNLHGPGTLTKTGAGTLAFLDAIPGDAFTTRINAGTCVLSNRQGYELLGPLIVGDGLGGAAADVVLLVASNQIGGEITVDSSGFLNLNGNPAWIQSLTLRGGSLSTGTGLLRIRTNLLTSLASSRTAVINGRLDIRNTAPHLVDVAEGVAYPGLLVNASMGGTSDGLIKTGPGALTLARSNSYTGLTLVEEGTLIVEHAWALGANSDYWDYTHVTNSAVLVVDRASVVNERLSHESTSPLTLYGPGSWAGPVEFRPRATGRIDVPSGTFELRGAVHCWILEKTGAGTLRLSSAQEEPIGASAYVDEGALELENASDDCFSTRFVIGDDSGGTEADVVRLMAHNQVGSSASITVNSSGLLDVHGYTDSIGSLTLNGGRVATGAGILWLGASLTNNATLAARSIISGRLGLPGTRTFYIAGHAWSPDLRVDASIAGAGGLTKTGSGELSLNASNSYSGVTTVNQGTLEVDHSWALGDTGNGTAVNGAGHVTVRYDSQVNIEALTLDTAGLLALKSALGSNSWAGPITLSSDARIDVDAEDDYLHLRGVISGVGSIIKTGEGTLLFSGAANTYTGDTSVNEGVLELQKAGLNAIPNGQLTVGDALGAARSDIVRLKSHNQIGAIPVRVNSSGYLDLNGHDENFGALTLDGGTVNTGSGRLTLAGSVTALDNAAGNPALWGELDLGSVGTRAIEVQGSPESPETLTISASVRGTPILAKRGAGTLVLSGSNSYSGITRVEDGILAAAHSLALGTTNGTTVVSNRASLLLASGSRITNEWLTLNGAGNASHPFALGSLSGTHSWSGPIALATDSTVSADPADSTLTLSGAITGNGGLTKTGPGTLQLGGNTPNSFNGTTRVHAGVLELTKTVSDGALAGPVVIGDNSAGPDADAVRIGVGAVEQIGDTVPVTLAGSGLLDVRSGGERIGALAGAGHLHLEGAIFEVNYDNESSVFSGQITGSGSPRKTGSGTLVLSGTNTHTGTTVVNNGRLQVDGFQPASPVQVATAGTLSGAGTVGRVTVAGGRVAPGAGAGILTCSNVTFSATSTFEVDLNGTTAGSSYDQLLIRGTNLLGGASLDVRLGFAPQEGDSFRIISNDGTDPMGGTFAGLAEGGILQVNGLRLRITYAGGTGNDVMLAVTNTPLSTRGAVAVLGGNGNGVIDPDECSTLWIAITNRSKDTVRGIVATLASSTPGVFIPRSVASYPDLAAGGAGTNTTPFQVSTLPGFPCGADLELELIVGTLAHGTFTVSLTLSTGTSGKPINLDQNLASAIPDNGALESPLKVSGVTSPLAQVVVSCHILHPNDADLDLVLVAPDGTQVELSTDNGGTGNNYGTSCATRDQTTFTDGAARPITSGFAPFAASYQPEQLLGKLRGKSGSEVNGTWLLRVGDDTVGNAGTLQCWSLTLYPLICEPGGGPCSLCADQTLAGAIDDQSPIQDRRLFRTGTNSTCERPTVCPGLSGIGTRHYDAYPFISGASNSCITVALRAECNLFSAAYLESYDPTSLCTHYLADRGLGTVHDPLLDYSFLVPANAIFVVVVSQVDTTDLCPYTLTVTGGSCVPRLDIAHVGTNRVVLVWPTFAPDYLLESASHVGEPVGGFDPETVFPVVHDGRYHLTNTVSSSNRFYRLHKP